MTSGHSGPAALPESAIERLMTVGEALVGEVGVAAASMRAISRMAGQGNTNAVRYHFGGIAGLLSAINRRHACKIERRRAKLLAAQSKAGTINDVPALLDVLYRPLLEDDAEDRNRVYARFVLAQLSAPDGWKLDAHIRDVMPISAHIDDLLVAALPHVSMELLQERHRLVTIMLLTSVVNRRAQPALRLSDAALIENAMNMAIAAVIAPAGSTMEEVAHGETRADAAINAAVARRRSRPAPDPLDGMGKAGA